LLLIYLLVCGVFYFYEAHLTPTLSRLGPYRFFVYSADGNEPIHVHVERDKKIAKIWLDPVRIQSSGGFSRSEINSVYAIVEENEKKLIRKWHDYFGD